MVSLQVIQIRKKILRSKFGKTGWLQPQLVTQSAVISAQKWAYFKNRLQVFSDGVGSRMWALTFIIVD